MENSIWFHLLLGALVVGVPTLSDRLLKDHVRNWVRIALGFLVAAATGVIIVLGARLLEL